MSNHTLYVGLDTDKKHIDIAVADSQPPFEVRYVGKIANEALSLQRALRRLAKDGRALVVCYEAGPCGYGIYRRLSAMPGVVCQVVAPSLIPRRPGERVKTNRRDALSLARLLRADELTAVWVPDASHEAIRDLVRAREAAVAALIRSRQHITSFLLRQEVGYAGKPWTKKHRAWLGRLDFAEPAHRQLFVELLVAVDQAQARRDRLTDLIAEQIPAWSLGWLAEALQALRGYRLINAATLVAEVGDPRRFDSPRQLMAFLGLVSSEYSTGERQHRGAITKTGNRRARKAQIEAAWTYTRQAKMAPDTRYPPALAAIADKARHRLSARYRRLTARGKTPQIAAVAIARELVGFVWALAHAAAPDRPTTTSR